MRSCSGALASSRYCSNNRHAPQIRTDRPARASRSWRASPACAHLQFQAPAAMATTGLAIESTIEELAGRLGIDGVAFRLLNLRDRRARRVVVAAARMAGWSGRWQPSSADGGIGLGFARFKNAGGYCAAAVEVEASTEIRVRHVHVAVDVGAVINPDAVRNQIAGAVVQAISWTLHEEVRVGPDRVELRSWDDYPILRFSQVPTIDVRLVGSDRSRSVGVGEVAIGPVAAATVNAASNALGIRLRELPLTPPGSSRRLVETTPLLKRRT